MAQGSSTVPPPPSGDGPGNGLTGDPNTDIRAQGNGGGMDRFRGLVSRLSGGGTPAIDAALKSHHDQIMADASRHADVAKQNYTLYHKAVLSGKNPLNGQPITPDDPLVQEWKRKADGAWADYGKIAGKAKEAKPIIEKMGGLLKHLGGGGSGAAGQSQAKQGQQTVAPPPQGQAPQQVTVPPSPNPLEESATGAAQSTLMAQQDSLSADAGKKEAEEAATISGMQHGLKAAGFTDDQIREVIKAKVGGPAIRAKSMHPVKVSNPDGTQVPALQDPTTGEVFGPDGSKIDNPTIIPTAMMETVHTGEMPVFNPETNQFEQQPTRSTSQKVMPKAASKPANGRSAPHASNKPTGISNPAPGSGGRHGIPARQYNILQKQATAVDEARNSLVGPDPSKGVGGLAADLAVFDNPDSVRRISEYLALVNSQIANEAKAVAGQGAWAAAEWYVGLPQSVIALQQGALADASRSLSSEEQRFVADYYRVLGTIGGMRAATGASSAQWSYNTLRGELPTPGPVTNRTEAGRRINNFVQETNVVAKRNPLLQPATGPTDTRGKVSPPPTGDDLIYAKGPDGVIHQAKKGTPLRKGFTPVDGPTATK